jgi:hypothetical protein
MEIREGGLEHGFGQKPLADRRETPKINFIRRFL